MKFLALIFGGLLLSFGCMKATEFIQFERVKVQSKFHEDCDATVVQYDLVEDVYLVHAECLFGEGLIAVPAERLKRAPVEEN